MIQTVLRRSYWISFFNTGLCVAYIVIPVLMGVGCRSADQYTSTPPAQPPSSISSEGELYFVDVTQQAKIDFVHSFGDGYLSNLVESVGGGVVFLDYDQDGYLDLYVVNGTFVEGVSEGRKPKGTPKNRLYHNRQDGTFEEVTDQARVGDRGFGMGVAAGDYDNDGYPDIYITNYGPNVLYHNNGNGTFSDVTTRAGVGGNGCSVGAVWLDYDKDGLLDLYVGNYIQFDSEYSYYYAPDGFPGPLAYAGQADVLYHNRGDGTFGEVTESTGVFNPAGRAMGVSAADYDDDGYVDIYVANDAMENYLYHNEGGQRFRELALLAGVAYNEMGDATSSMAVDFADYNGDGLTDIFVSDISYSALYRNEGQGLFRDVTTPVGIAVASGQYVGWAAAFIDYDNDGDVDIFQVNGDLEHLYGQEDQLFENLGEGGFRDVSVERGSYFQRELVGRGACFGDYDNDGDVDAFIVNLNDNGVLLRNERGNRNNWLLIRLIGRLSNRDGVGTMVKVNSGDQVQVAQKKSSSGYLSQNDPRLHFGLGKNQVVDWIEIVWPSGKKQVLEKVQAGQILTIVEP
ncbi:MAG: CRTAC1 family protein [Anaerolineales bacterium]